VEPTAERKWELLADWLRANDPARVVHPDYLRFGPAGVEVKNVRNPGSGN
jgi:hypothetical protein